MVNITYRFKLQTGVAVLVELLLLTPQKVEKFISHKKMLPTMHAACGAACGMKSKQMKSYER